MPGKNVKMTEARREKQREYMRAYVARKKAAKLAEAREGGITSRGTNRLTKLERSRKAKAAWRAKRAAEAEDQMPVVQMETTVDVPSDIEPGILAATSDNGMATHLLPTGATLIAEVWAGFRKLAIAIKEVGAETGVFTWPDGTTVTVRGDGSIITS